MPRMSVASGVGEARREARQRDLVAARDEVVDAAEDAQRAERRDDRRHPEDRHDDAVDHAQDEPEAEPEQRSRPARRAACSSRSWRRSRRPGPIIASTERSTFRVMTTSASPTAATAMIDGEDGDLPEVGDGQELRRRDRDEPAEDDHDRDEAELALARDRAEPARRGRAGPPGPTAAPASAIGGCRRVGVGGVGRLVARCCPVAANITRSSVARSRGISAVIRPSWRTRIRSDIARTSGRSLEMRMIPRPDAASSEMIRWTSTLAPMSMPRVGSSRIRSRGFEASHLASTTFCWLPPDSAPTSWSTPVIRTLNCSV